VLHEDCVGPDVLEEIEVLGKEQKVHNVLGACSLDIRFEVIDGLLESINDGLPLPGDSDSAEVPTLGLGFGGLYLPDFVSLSLRWKGGLAYGI